MPSEIVAVVDTADAARNVVEALTREGVPRGAITVMSSEPLHMDAGDAAKTRIGGFSIAGGLVGAAFALLLTISTSRRVGLITGGMPIVSPWAFGIIVFELTALGGILATLGRMIYEAGLVRRSPLADHGSAVAEDQIVLAVRVGENLNADVLAAVIEKTRQKPGSAN